MTDPAAETPTADSGQPRRDFRHAAALGTTALGLWPVLARGATATATPATGKSAMAGTSSSSKNGGKEPLTIVCVELAIRPLNPRLISP